MRQMSFGPLGVLLLGGVNFALLVIIAQGLLFNTPVMVDRTEWKMDLLTSWERTESKRTINSYKEILARPVFYKDRQPFIPPPVATPAPAVASWVVISDPEFIFGGVIITDQTKKVYIFTKANNSGVWTKEGDEDAEIESEQLTRVG
jgi:hypothetical protein